MRTRILSTLLLCGAVVMAAPKAKTPLSIVNTVMAQYEDGPRLPADLGYGGGDLAFFSFEISGYQKSEKEHIHLTWSWRCLDPSGVLLVEPAEGKLETDVSPEDKDWLPKVRQNFEIPFYAPSGAYHLQISLHDVLANADATADVPYLVRGHRVEPSDTLTVRNFRFFRSEDDSQPMEVAAYRPGESVWARFDIIGYKLGPGNVFDVQYGLSVIRPDGKPGFSQPEAATLKDKSFYPRRYTPAALSLTLPADVAKGEHTIVLTVRDNIGNQTSETQYKFSVE
ncbi:MAG TPA: hypothetical protein VMJ34_03240 [Bryobacteraceae bacterium]|nr:hypothetical protein [Bryobacteraceae bacterium]